MSDVETFFLCPLSHLLEEERKAWANQIGIMVIVNPLAQLDGDSEWVRYSDYARLKAEVERLRKAGDAMANLLSCAGSPPNVVQSWNAAKDGKLSE